MTQINIEINCEHEDWYKTIPNANELIAAACKNAVNATKITSFAEEIEISVMLANDAAIRELNSEYRQKDKPTNVLSFPSDEFSAGEYENAAPMVMLGDIIFALETIENEAAEQDKKITDHLSHLAVHGTLHLLGYDHIDDDEAEIMEALEVKILEKMDIADPYADE